VRARTNTVPLVAADFNVVIPAKAGIQFAVDLLSKVKMDPSVRWGDELMVWRLNEQHWG
jgi:hypothetical protein